jgi:hypothetical protein
LNAFTSLQNISARIQRTAINNTMGDSAGTGVIDSTNGYLYLGGSATIYRVLLTNLNNVTTLNLPEAILPVTSFLSTDSNGVTYANFPSFGAVGNASLTQVILSKFTLPVSNSTRVYSLQYASNIQSSAYDNVTRIAYLASYDGVVEAVRTDSLTTTLHFNLINFTIDVVRIDSLRQLLYLCGELNQVILYIS